MAQRRIWVQRPNASATQIRVNEDDLVDDLREIVLAKYQNTLGATCDAPDITLRIREAGNECALNPDEEICRVLEACYPDGQTVAQALVVVIPSDIETTRQLYTGAGRGRGQLPPTPPTVHFDHLSGAAQSAPKVLRRTGSGRTAPSPLASLPAHAVKEVSVAETQVPRKMSASAGQQLTNSRGTSLGICQPSHAAARSAQLSASHNNTSTGDRNPVPPISVLIVEDNPISLRLLEQRLKGLGVRCQSATNGQIALERWKTGTYHLVLMDIQMPVMDGIQATREIRRLEGMHGIGNILAPPPEDHLVEASGESIMPGLLKSPVIIVALTASSLESDRHAALNAGCNDFLTKPVNDEVMQRKVREWASMQALVDIDGWGDGQWRRSGAPNDGHSEDL